MPRMIRPMVVFLPSRKSSILVRWTLASSFVYQTQQWRQLLHLTRTTTRTTTKLAVVRSSPNNFCTSTKRNHSCELSTKCCAFAAASPVSATTTTGSMNSVRCHSTSSTSNRNLVSAADAVAEEGQHDTDDEHHNNTSNADNNNKNNSFPWHQRMWHSMDHGDSSSPKYWTQSFWESSISSSSSPPFTSSSSTASSNDNSTASSPPTLTSPGSSLHDRDPVEFWASDDDHNHFDHQQKQRNMAKRNTATTTASSTTTGSSTSASSSSTTTKANASPGRLRVRQLGVLDQDPVRDVQLLTENYTVPSLAIALRDREDVLQQCAELALQQDWNAICTILEPFQHQYVLERRQQHTIHHGYNKKNHPGILVSSFTTSDPTHMAAASSPSSYSAVKPLDTNALELIRKALMRMPRQVISAHTQRAGVVVPLCHVHSVPSLLLERRAGHLTSHPNEVCLPGGMICKIHDRTIVATCLREMREEIPALSGLDINVLGVLRCNWGDLHHLVGVAVTPVVCWLGEIEHVPLQPNPSEVSQVFTIPLVSLLDPTLWRHQEGYAPVFVGGPFEIWGLTGYILERFAQDILLPHSSCDVIPNNNNNLNNQNS